MDASIAAGFGTSGLEIQPSGVQGLGMSGFIGLRDKGLRIRIGVYGLFGGSK